MTMFEKPVLVTIPELDTQTAQSIYWSLKELLEKENVIDTGLYYPEHVLDVRNEIKVLEWIAYSAMMREDSPSNESELQSELYSDILDIPTFVTDFIDYTVGYKENTTWEEFVEQFTFLKSQDELI